MQSTPPVIAAFDSVLSFLRGGFLAVAVTLAGVCTVDWLVRSKRISPFNPIARFMRANVDPLLAPVERRVVRAGGLPQSAPWWALVVVVVAGIVFLSLLEFIQQQLLFVFVAVGSGPAGVYHLLVAWTFAILQLAIIVRIILSWVRMRPGSWITLWSYRLSEPILKPLRRVIPNIGMVDITPMVAYFGLSLLQGFFQRLV
jgi:YggT family protein